MFYSYITLTFRNIIRKKIYAFITIVGFAIGLAATYFASTFVNNMLGVDTHHRLSDRLYIAVYDKIQNGESVWKTALNFPSLKHEIEAEFPQVEKVARINLGDSKLSYNNRSFQESTFFIDTTLFLMIDFDIVKGQKVNALKNRNSVMISTKLARKLFGNEDPIGKIITRNKKEEFVVTAVYSRFLKSYFTSCEAFFPYHFFGSDMQYNWENFSTQTMILLKPNTKVESLNGQLTPLLRKHRPLPMEGILEKLHLEKLPDIYKDEKIMQKPYWVNATYLYIYSLLVFVILGVSCINYINLTTAKATERAREVGIRKVLGAKKQNLITQFLIESSIYSFLAGIIALFLIIFAIPNIECWIYSKVPNYVANYINDYDYLSQFNFWKVFFLIFLVGSITCAVYPALILSSFNPLDVLKKEVKTGYKNNIYLRNSLIVFQFTISLALIIFTYCIYINNEIMQSKEVNFNVKNRILFYDFEALDKDSSFIVQFNKIKAELLKDKNIKRVSYSSYVPSNIIGTGSYGRLRLPKNPEPDPKPYATFYVENDFLTFYEMPLLAGRHFSEKITSDATSSVIITDLATTQMGFKNPLDALNEVILFDKKPYKIIGILEDFRSSSTLIPVPVLFFIYNKNNYLPTDYITLQYGVEFLSGNPGDNVQHLLNKLKILFPKIIFEALDMKQYYDEEFVWRGTRSKFYSVYSIVAILISCMGLYGLSMFVISRRTKEISIRKILGASENQLVILLTSAFMKLVLLSVLFGSIIGYFAINHYLEMDQKENKHLHHPILWHWIFIPAMGVILIAILSMVVQTWQKAREIPVKGLKTE